MDWYSYLPSSICDEEEGEWNGRARHGVGGGHTVLRVVKHLHFDHGRRSGTRPTDHILGTLSHVHDPNPHYDKPPAHEGVQVPDDKREEDDVEELVAQLSSEGEEVVQEPVLDQELLAGVTRQRVSAQRFYCAAHG